MTSFTLRSVERMLASVDLAAKMANPSRGGHERAVQGKLAFLRAA
jgi:hypothetical protein